MIRIFFIIVRIITRMVKEPSKKQKLTLSVDSEIVEKARKLDINISDITEKVLSAFTSSLKNVNKEELYKRYQELFNMMLPLLKKFRVNTRIGNIQIEDAGGIDPNFPEDGNIPMIFDIYLEPHGGFTSDGPEIKNIEDISPEDFDTPQDIVDNFISSIQEGVDYGKEQFKEIEMAQTIIDALTKPTLWKSIKRRKRK